MISSQEDEQHMHTVGNSENRKKITRRFSVLSDFLGHLSPVLPDRPIPPAFFLSSPHPLDETEQNKAFIFTRLSASPVLLALQPKCLAGALSRGSLSSC